MGVQSLGQEDPLEEVMAIHSSILAWRIPWTEESGGLYIVYGVTRVGLDLATKPHIHIYIYPSLQDTEYSSLCYTVGPYYRFYIQ